ncbi:flagellar biosynthesis protein FliH [Sphingomonas sp. Leaf231]|uniref:FliH/SctL family protein n=1 Tax=Sphingomonas sp. Leaf231 TaxID=1736301 RepID=UPI0006FEE437|nr:flagellar biosynthesis protein FliH [Sphingomonas sp. Leaf231]KQN92367.1 flagellar biosynthesis protein FliH [Sphingomonas sp. Leaf231]
MFEADFVIGMPSRANAAALTRSRAQSEVAPGFTPADLIARIEQAFGARSPMPEPQAGAEPTGDQPRHFSPADRDADPTAGWDMLDADAPIPACVEQIEAARIAGYQDGLADAANAADAVVARERELLEAVAESMKAGGAIDRVALADALRRTVTMLVTQLVGEIGVSAPLLAARVEAATELLADASESAMLRVHPEDMPLLEGRLPGTVFPVGDESVARGSFVLEAASTIVEDGPAMWLEQLTTAIERAAVPAC